jgi:hypothetical protein
MANAAIAHETLLDLIEIQIVDAKEKLASAKKQRWELVELAGGEGLVGAVLGVLGIGSTVVPIEDAGRDLASLQAQEQALIQMGTPSSLNPLQEVDLKIAGVQGELRQLDKRERRGVQVASQSVIGGILAVRDSFRTASLREELLQEQAALEREKDQIIREAPHWQRADPTAPVYALGNETVYNVIIRMGGLGPFGGTERNLMNITQKEIKELEVQGYRVQVLETIEPYPL